MNPGKKTCICLSKFFSGSAVSPTPCGKEYEDNVGGDGTLGCFLVGVVRECVFGDVLVLVGERAMSFSIFRCLGNFWFG